MRQARQEQQVYETEKSRPDVGERGEGRLVVFNCYSADATTASGITPCVCRTLAQCGDVLPLDGEN